jgi:hypothetical protein
MPIDAHSHGAHAGEGELLLNPSRRSSFASSTLIYACHWRGIAV